MESSWRSNTKCLAQGREVVLPKPDFCTFTPVPVLVGMYSISR